MGDMDITPYTQEYTNYLINLAHSNLLRGVVEEPRVYFDEIIVPPAPIQRFSGPNIFKNGERFPVRLTHMTLASNLFASPAPFALDENIIQRIGVQLRFHDQWYMNPQFVAAPNWSTQPTATAPGISQTTSTWRFLRPIVLGVRDSLEVQVALLAAPQEGAFPVNVTFTAIGIESKRPYFFNGQIGLFDTATRTIPTNFYRNDGAEPCLIVDLTVNIANVAGDENPIGDIRNLRVQVRQIGNGTNARWMIGPVLPGPQAVGAQNLGIYSGRVIVHEFPGNGLLWEPGEGIDVAVQGFYPDNEAVAPVLNVALAGYIAVQ